MVSKNQIKLIASLHQKKYRDQNGLFIAEGFKVINELLHSDFELQNIYQTTALFSENQLPVTTVSETDLNKMSALKTANNCLAVFKMAPEQAITPQGFQLVLDDVRDPGNLGTIIRLCDWFGIPQLICSLQTADLYNPKVVQATMGSITRVRIIYTDLLAYLSSTNLPIMGTFMDGENVYATPLPKEGILILGNEANGISSAVEALVQQRLAIPRFGAIQKTESLNVATAAAIFLSEMRRRD
ncbi:TrmH family RNA methyltransferase [Flavobacterium sp. N1719]|uniref:TrmH family RNA methyltransferase n=1 Tax=Flavobacterium sp. N1719 TaxID=2885633 RepID=UPI002222418F|nr:RNA methyltransferase [Flavobacterium sp. N1719]